MMTNLLNSAALCATVLLSSSLCAQKRSDVLKEPVNWSEVRFDHNRRTFVDSKGGAANEEYWRLPSSRSATESDWRVSTDKAGVKLREKPVGDAPLVEGVLDFGTMLYVYKDEGEWLQVGPTRQGAAGWCHKRDLVLWSRPLLEHITGIELKALLVNKLSLIGDDLTEIMDAKKQTYTVYDGPGKDARVIKSDFLYDVLYIYKHAKSEKVGDRWLVGIHSELGGNFPLLGWVSNLKVQIWDTRLCLEPNFDEAAQAERKQKGIRASVFQDEDQSGQNTFLKTGMGKGLVDGEERDPAFRSNPMSSARMDGKLFRYPVLNAAFVGGSTNCNFKTGVSGRMTLGSSELLPGFKDDDYLRTSRTYDAIKERKGSLSVVFVVEGSAGLKEHIETVKGTIKSMQGKYRESHTLRYGVVYYRNEMKALNQLKNPESDYLEVLPITSNVEQVLNWLDARTARDAGDKGEARAAYFALKRGLDLFQRYETNVLVHICRRPDNTVLTPLFKGKTVVDPTTFGDGMDLGRASHYLGYVTMGTGDLLSSQVRREAYEGMVSDVMQNLGDAISNQLKGVVDFGKDKTGKATAAEAATSKLSNGTEETRLNKHHFVLKATLLNAPDKNLQSSIVADLGSCMSQNDATMKAVESVVEDESIIKDRASDITYYAGEMTIFSGPNGEAIKRHLAANKVHLFIDARTFYKAADLKQPLFRYVLFYDERGLDDEIRALQEVNLALEKGISEEVREKLKEIWKRRAEATLGNKAEGRTDLASLRSKVMGIHKLNMVRPFEDASVLKGITLDDLNDQKSFKQKDLGAYANTARENLQRLTEIKTSSNFYVVPGDERRKYFWVPIEYLFN